MHLIQLGLTAMTKVRAPSAPLFNMQRCLSPATLYMQAPSQAFIQSWQ